MRHLLAMAVVAATLVTTEAMAKPGDKIPTKPMVPPPVKVDAAVWVTPIPSTTLTFDATADVSGTYEPASSGVAAVRWHQQVSRDEGFNDLALDVVVKSDVRKLEAKKLTPGTYVARLAGISSSMDEGSWSDTRAFNIARAVVTPASTGKRATVDVVGKGLFCGLDGGALSPVGAPIELSPARAHTLRCASSQDGKESAELTIASELAGPVTLQTTFGDPTSDDTGATRSMIVKVSDAAGAPVTGVAVVAQTEDGVTLSPFVESTPGTYTASLRTKFGKAALLKVTVAGLTQVQSATAVDAPAAAAPPDVVEPFRKWELGGSLGVNDASARFGPGLALSIDFGFRKELGSGLLSIGLRPAYERYQIGQSHDVSCGAQGSDPNCGRDVLSYVQAMSADVFALGLPIGYRFFASKPVMPYVMLMPQLLVAGIHERAGAAITTTLRPTEDATTNSSATSFALVGAVGVAARMADHGTVFLELGARTARTFALPQGDGRLAGVSASVGFRYAF